MAAFISLRILSSNGGVPDEDEGCEVEYNRTQWPINRVFILLCIASRLRRERREYCIGRRVDGRDLARCFSRKASRYLWGDRTEQFPVPDRNSGAPVR